MQTVLGKTTRPMPLASAVVWTNSMESYPSHHHHLSSFVSLTGTIKTKTFEDFLWTDLVCSAGQGWREWGRLRSRERRRGPWPGKTGSPCRRDRGRLCHHSPPATGSHDMESEGEGRPTGGGFIFRSLGRVCTWRCVGCSTLPQAHLISLSEAISPLSLVWKKVQKMCSRCLLCWKKIAITVFCAHCLKSNAKKLRQKSVHRSITNKYCFIIRLWLL